MLSFVKGHKTVAGYFPKGIQHPGVTDASLEDLIFDHAVSLNGIG
jgi:hypothetical protein